MLQPDWATILPWRSPSKAASIGALFAAAGLPAHRVAVIVGNPAAFDAAAESSPHDPDWAEPFGGRIAAVLIAAELAENAACEQLRYSTIRARTVSEIADIDQLSIVKISQAIGVSRQMASRLARTTRVAVSSLVGSHLRRTIAPNSRHSQAGEPT